MITTIHQPEHLPWLGFFHKASQADVFVILDSVQYRKRYFHNRNKIRVKEGWVWVNVPVKKDTISLSIKDVEIDNSKNWSEKAKKAISLAYKRTPFFDQYYDALDGIYSEKWHSLCELNIELLIFLFESLSIKPKILRSSEMQAEGKASDLMLNITKETKADTYLSGISGKDYLDLSKFKDEELNVEFQEFHHPIYKQLYDPFIPCMSVIDLLFNHGPESLNIIKGKGVPVMDELFL